MVVGLLGFCGIGGKLMLPVRGKLMGKGTPAYVSLRIWKFRLWTETSSPSSTACSH
jgi:hypothetical protein